MAATFNTPIAGVILAIELLLFEFRGRSFVPLVIATTLATSIRQVLLGNGPMFHVLPMDFGIPGSLPYYLVLGVLCGFAAVVFTKALYFMEDGFDRLPISEFWHPAIGALALGSLDFLCRAFWAWDTTPRGHSEQQPRFEGPHSRRALQSRRVAALTGIGHVGRIARAHVHVFRGDGRRVCGGRERYFAGRPLSSGACALVAMAAVFGAASRATFAFIVFAFEIVRDYNAVFR